MDNLEFIETYKRVFTKNDERKIRFKMGEKKEGEERVCQVLSRFEEISNYIFNRKEVWVLLIIWDANGENKKELVDAGFNEGKADEYHYGQVSDGLIKEENFSSEALLNSEILYLKYNSYSFERVRPLIYSKAGFELGFERTAGIVAYFISFENCPILLNLYDDRGMEVLVENEKVMDEIHNRFVKYIIE